MESCQCVSCGSTNMVHEERTVLFEYKGERLEVPNMSGWFCTDCAEAELDDGLGVVYFDAIQSFIKQVDEKEREWLAGAVKQLKLSKTQTVAITGGGKNAFAKYIKGDASPVQAVYVLMSLLKNHPTLVPEVLAMPRVKAKLTTPRRKYGSGGFTSSWGSTKVVAHKKERKAA